VTEAAAVPLDARPRLPHGVRLVHNEAHGGWVLLAPERVFKADPIAASCRPIRRLATACFPMYRRCCGNLRTAAYWNSD
jgi:hypothetical protein